ncbi:MAG: ABC transporter substrate-binding protein [Burkholderiales bacterium]|nr:ABC transporter substrate-binding protein [Burkholderiales bacterium]
MLTRLIFIFIGQSALAFSVVFVNPGKSTETYWVSASQAMSAAATSLGIQLDVQYAERDPMRLEEIVRDVVARPANRRPDYLIITDERGMGLPQLKVADAAGIKTFFAFSSPLAETRQQVGYPRGRYPHWIGSLEPDSTEAGFQTAIALIQRAVREKRYGPDGRLHLIAISGDHATSTSINREMGLKQALERAPNVTLDQVVYGDWARDKARLQADVLFKRYPSASMVWAGNDQMAFGAMEALEASGGSPGKDKYFSGINTSEDAMADVRSGRMEALSGGHFMTGAWALIMLYDYEHGKDFASEGLELKKPMFMLFDAQSAALYKTRFGEGIRDVDFMRFSKVGRPALKQYDFRFAQLMIGPR